MQNQQAATGAADQTMSQAPPAAAFAGQQQMQQQQQPPPSVDMNTLAAFVQQFNQQKTAQPNTGVREPSIHEALAAALSKGGNLNLNRDGAAPAAAAASKDGGGAPPPPVDGKPGSSMSGADAVAPGGGGGGGKDDAQNLMEQIATLTKSLENEKTKSKALQEEKKREMKGFLTGIQDYVNSLDGVKDPNAKGKFMEGMQNMANHGIPNGVYDIMVSASAQNEQNMKTIEALTKGYTDLKDKYEGPGQFGNESSRFVDPTLNIIGAGTKRKTAETETEKVPVGMWDFFGETVAAAGYAAQPDLLSGQ